MSCSAASSVADWVNLAKVSIPQADEQQRLLANLIETMNRHRKPLPRFWYFPRSLKAVLVGTGDDHASGGTAGRFDQYLAASPAGCSVADWTCPRFTSYIFTATPLTNANAATYNNQGFEVALHPDTGCEDFTPTSLAQTFSTQLSQFRAKYRSLPAPGDQPDALPGLERLVQHADDRAGERHAARRDLLLLAAAPGSRTGPGS